MAFIPVKNEVFIRALHCEYTEYTPIWLMRQAGRYLPEYRATRAKAGNFMALCTNPELACEVTLQPLARYPLDAAILFSDILTVPDAMGLGLYFEEGEGPKFQMPLRNESDVMALKLPDVPTTLNYVFDAVKLIRHELAGKVPLIGFAGSPFTLACYMIEGGSSREFRTIKTMMYQRPDLLHHVLKVTTQAVIEYLQLQIASGAQAVMLFDSWGGALAEGAFQQFSLQYMLQIVQALPKAVDRGGWEERIPSIVFTKGGGQWLHEMAGIGCDALGVDWTVNLGNARSKLAGRCALQGNLDPMVLLAGEEAIQREAKTVLDAFGVISKHNAGHVFNLGHGITQWTPPEAVEVLVHTVHEYSRTLRV